MLLSITIGVSVSVMIGVGSSLGSQTDVVNNLDIVKTGEISYKTMFDFCRTENNIFVMGVMIKSEVESIIIPVDNYMDLGQCHKYGTNIHTSDTSSLVFSLFARDDFNDIVILLEKQLTITQDLVISAEQDLLKIQNIEPENLEKINTIKNKLNSYREILDSTKSSIKAIRGME